MTKQYAVLLAFKALVQAALPGAKVRGFDEDTTKPARGDPEGTVIGHPGDPGEPEVDLGPLTYHYEHEMKLEVAAGGNAGGETLDAMLVALGAGIRADRTLGGLCAWLEAGAPDRNDGTTEALATSNWAIVPVVAHYSTPDPLA